MFDHPWRPVGVFSVLNLNCHVLCTLPRCEAEGIWTVLFWFGLNTVFDKEIFYVVYPHDIEM